MGRGNCCRASWTLFAREPAALFTRTRAQSRAAGAFDFSRGRLFTGELAFSTVVASVLCQRPCHLTSNDIVPAATHHPDFIIESRRRLALPLRPRAPAAPTA